MTTKIVIGTPMRGWEVGGAHHASMWPFMRACLDQGAPRFEIVDPGKILADDDLVRTRSRIVRLFLDETDGDKLLFVDSDIVANVEAFRGMLAEDVDCISSTYPKKRLDAFGIARDYAVNVEPRTPIVGSKARVNAVGMGFMLLSRELLTTMRDDLDEEFGADDEGKRTTMMFFLKFGLDARGKRHMWPEDYSFCSRVREYTDCWLYTGRGAPLSHEGHFIYQGHAEHVHPRTKSDAQIMYEDADGVTRAWGDDNP